MKLCKKCRDFGHLIAGQAFTHYTCDRCGERHNWHNIDTPKICRVCSDTFNVCMRCQGRMFGGDE